MLSTVFFFFSKTSQDSLLISVQDLVQSHLLIALKFHPPLPPTKVLSIPSPKNPKSVVLLALFPGGYCQGLEQCLPQSKCSIDIFSMNDGWMSSPRTTSYRAVTSTTHFYNKPKSMPPGQDSQPSLRPTGVHLATEPHYWPAPRHLKVKIYPK